VPVQAGLNPVAVRPVSSLMQFRAAPLTAYWRASDADYRHADISIYLESNRINENKVAAIVADVFRIDLNR
jgi:hypothetical protein